LSNPPRTAPGDGRRYRGTLAGDGRPGPIEERIGRRLVRLVDPESGEGRRLLFDGLVDLVGPDGDALGKLEIREAYRRLALRLEARLEEEPPSSREDLAAGLERLRGWSRRMLSDPPRATRHSPDSPRRH
jgi:hypothetical protein